MTDILCEWMNNDLKLSKSIDPNNFASDFSNGFFIGEVLSKYQLQDDFGQFSQSRTADSKLNNFTRLEPVLKLLGIPFDTNTAHEVMTEEPGSATRLMYQLFIALENKKKANLTGVAMETMRPAAPAKLQGMESLLYKERLKQMTPRQTDLNLRELVERFHQHQLALEDRAFRQRIASAEHHQRSTQEHRSRQMERTKQLKLAQSELMAKIEAAVVHIPKPPPNKTAAAIENRKKARRAQEADEALNDLDRFEDRLKRMLPSTRVQDDAERNRRAISAPFSVQSTISGGDTSPPRPLSGITAASPAPAVDPIQFIMPASNDEYIGRIRRRLEEDQHARVEREKRRRKVLVDCLTAHQEQEESRREELMANRLMRQSQMERRIAVQLLQARHEKAVLKANRRDREMQYQAMREKEFQEAMDREKAMEKEARLACADQLAHEAALHERLVTERLEGRYRRHYELCFDVTLSITDFACRVAEYRGYTEKKVPAKLYRDWKALFCADQPLYDEPEEVTEEQEKIDVIVDEKQKILDETDFTEYQSVTGEWSAPDTAEIKEPPPPNPIIGWIVNRLYNIVFPPTPPPSKPEFPPFPIKVAITGKIFAGKSSVINRLMENNRCVSFVVEQLVEEALEAARINEQRPETPPPPPPPVAEEPAAPTPAPEAAPADTGRESASTLATEAAGSSIPVDQSSSVHSLTRGNSPAAPPSTADIKQKSNLSSRSKESEKSTRLTNRAKIGQKLAKSLKKGKAMDDALVVEVLCEAIRQVPEGTGWILDGFPANYNQAKLLEKALTGYEEAAGKGGAGGKLKPRKSTLAPNPRPGAPGEPPKSGLDAVILLDLEDVNCLSRAIGRTEAPLSGEKYHYDTRPPPEGSATGLGGAERVQAVQDADLDAIQARLTAFLEAWPKVEKFYARFGPALVQKLDANLEAEALYLEVEHRLDEILNKDAKPEETLQVEAESQEPPKEEAKEEAPKEEAPKEEAPKEEPKGSKRASRAGSAKRGSSRGSGKGSPAGSKRKGGSKSPAGSRPTSAEKKEKKGGSRASSAKSGRRSRSGSKGSRKGKSPEPEPDAEPQESTGPPPPEPGSPEWQFVDKDVPVEMAQALVSLWDSIEGGYMGTLKSSFRELRLSRENIIKYFYSVRRDFVAYLQRPDHKQEFVTSFQKDFNEISADMREDEDVMQDLHQRVDDLRDRLFDITDERKAAAERKREDLMKDGWLEDRIGLLINNYISLMQVEYDRFQDSAKFLKDYYKSMTAPVPEEFRADYNRLPLVDLPVEKEGGENGEGEAADGEPPAEPPAKAPSPSGKGKGKKEAAPAESEPHELTDAEIEAMFRTKIHLLPQRPTSTDMAAAFGALKGGKEKGKGAKDKRPERLVETPVPPTDPDEKILFDAFWNGCQLIMTYISTEQATRDAEEEAERAKQAEKEKEKNAKDKDKGKGGKGGKGKGKSRSPSPKKGKGEKGKQSAEPPATPVENEESEEDRLARETKERMRKEYFAALEKEAASARTRMELVRLLAAIVLTDLKNKSEDVFKDMYDWIGSRMLKENEVIDQLTVILRHAIEAKQPVLEQIDVSSDTFLLHSDIATLNPPQSASRPSPIEAIEPDQFKIRQIEFILKRLQSVAPGGIMAITEFVNAFQDIAMAAQEADVLPETWRQASASQLHDLAEVLSSDKEYVNWRSFMLTVSQPWPWPSQQQLLDTLAKFRDLDQLGSGRITREQFDFIDLWFTSSTLPPTPVDAAQPKVLDRLAAVKGLFFDFFLEPGDPPAAIDFESMLLHFAAAASPFVGFLRALSLCVGHHVAHKPLPGFEQETACDPTLEEVPPDLEDVHVPIESLYKVLTFGQKEQELPAENGEAPPEDAEEKKDGVSMETLVSIYQQLGSETLDPLPFTTLVRHATLVELILQNKQFKMVDLKAFMGDPGDMHSVRTSAD